MLRCLVTVKFYNKEIILVCRYETILPCYCIELAYFELPVLDGHGSNTGRSHSIYHSIYSMVYLYTTVRIRTTALVAQHIIPLWLQHKAKPSFISFSFLPPATLLTLTLWETVHTRQVKALILKRNGKAYTKENKTKKGTSTSLM